MAGRRWRSFFRLASDLPAGPYTVEVQLQEPVPPIAYATLYRVLPGQHPQRKVEWTEAVAQDLISETQNVSSNSPSHPAHESHTR